MMRALNSDAIVGFVGDVPEGRRALTLKAQINISDDRPNVPCYVKIYPEFIDGKEHKGLLNELIGYALAKATNMFTLPEFAGVVELSQKHLEQLKLEGPHRITLLAYFCSDIAQPSLKLAHMRKPGKLTPKASYRIMKSITSSGLAERIVAFDEWVFNVDRNLENLLQLPNDQLGLIDHGGIFGGEFWDPDQLTRSRSKKNQSNLIEILLGEEVDKLPFKNARLQTMLEFNELINKQENGSLGRILQQAFNNDDNKTRQVLNFLDQRSNGQNAAKQIGLLL